MNNDYKCKLCGRETFSYFHDFCEPCEQKREKKKVMVWSVSIILGFILSIILALFVASIQFNYELDKCENLEKPSYQFSHTLEVNAEYSSHCYYIQNNPLAFSGLVMLVLVPIMLVFMLIAIVISVLITP